MTESEKQDTQKLKEIGIGTPEMVRMFGFTSKNGYYRSKRRALYKSAIAETIRIAGEHLSK